MNALASEKPSSNAIYWPNVWSSAGRDRVTLDDGERRFVHHAKDLNVFANVSVGYAFSP